MVICTIEEIEEIMVNYRYHISPRIYLIGGNTEMGHVERFIERGGKKVD